MKKIVIPMLVSLFVLLLSRLFIPSPAHTVRAFFECYGFTLSENLLEKEELTLPGTFTPVYENYNKLQKRAGLDLTPYLGKKVTRYTYEIVNFPFETNSSVRANALVYRGKVIAADVMTVSSDGFMLSPADPIFSLDK